MFVGQSEHSIDQQGRVALPVSYRGELSDAKLVLVKGYFEKCLWLFETTEYGKMIDPFTDTVFDERKRGMVRYFTGSADHVELDSAKRFRISPEKQEFAELDKRVLFVGAANHIELWNPAEFETYMEEIDVGKLTEELMGQAAS